MKQSLKILSKILFVSFIAFPALGDTIKVGFPVPLTGEYAPYAEIQGAKCMAEIINKNGGVNFFYETIFLHHMSNKIEITLVRTNRVPK